MANTKQDTLSFEISKEEKIEYLNSLIGKMYKILHLIEEEKITGFEPKVFIGNQLVEIQVADKMFGGKLVNILVKLKIVQDNYETVPFAECKKQIFEIKKMINNLLK